VGLLTSKIELAFFDWVQVGRGLSEELGSELHRQRRNFFLVVDYSDQEMVKVQTQTDAFNLLTRTAMRALHQRYTLCASNAILICRLLNSPYAGSLSATTRTSSSRKEMPSH
jgi:hypothetical protein